MDQINTNPMIMNTFKYSFFLLLAAVLIVSCNSTQQKSNESSLLIDSAAIFQKGDTITAQVQKILLTNVMQAIKTGGPAYAVEFCNEKAISLTDSLAHKYNCRIQRVSDKYRNPVNKPDSSDAEIFMQIRSSGKMNPIIAEEKGQVVYYKPIKIAMPACLQCHGNPGMEVDLKTQDIIRQKYPEDLATGYKEGDLRGLWKITFLEN